METRRLSMPVVSRVIVISTLFSFANSLPWPVPVPTLSYVHAKWDPQPTNTPQLQLELLKRDDVDGGVDPNVCGWVAGNFSSPVTCSSGSQCVYETLHQVVGCCPMSGPCTTGVYTSCADSNNPQQAAPGANVLVCSSGSSCYQDTYPGGYRHYACGAYSDAKLVATTYVGQDPSSTFQAIFTALSAATTGSSAPLPSSSISSLRSSTLLTSSQSRLSTAYSSPQATVPVAEPTASSTIGAASSIIANTSNPSVAATTQDIQGEPGIIAGSVIGGLAAVLAISALACFFMRRRQRKSDQPIESFLEKKDNMSISSTTSSESSEIVQVRYYSPGDINSAPDIVLHPPSPPQLPTPPLQALVAHQTGFQNKISNATVSTIVEDLDAEILASLEAPWVRPPTPPPRSPKRLQRRSEQFEWPKQSEAIEAIEALEAITTTDDNEKSEPFIVERLPPLQLYSNSVSSSLLRSDTIFSSSSSTYSRATDGRSVFGSGIGRNECATEDSPQIPIPRKPVGTGSQKNPSLVTNHNSRGHIGYHIVDGATIERDRVGLPQTRIRSVSGPAPLLSPGSTFGNTARLSRNVSDGQRILDSDAVLPLRLKSPPVSAVPKSRSSLVPILSIPAAPKSGGREKRLYDIQ